ncbi:MAG: polysaccharide biosynthesis protein [Paludibacter sp.]|nr:polysaccharide biosynthesis protein [Paludibacter sp.]
MTHKSIKSHRHYDKAMHWGKLISITGSAQIIVQAVGFLSGILVIRLLPVEEYALYTLANTMLGTMTILADGGISTGVMAQGGKVWQDREKLGAVLATGLDLRRKFAIGSLVVSIPILAYLLLQHGASWITVTLIVISLIPAFYAALSDSLLEIVPKLHQDILPLQKNQVGVGLGRLALTGLTIFIFPFTYVAVLASGIPRIGGNIQLRKIANKFVDNNQTTDLDIRNNILLIVKKALPSVAYYCLSGQISIWILSVFGNTKSIAEIGALGRLSMFIGLFSVVFSTLVVPRFARQKDNFETLISYYSKALVIVLIISIFIIIFTYIFSANLLWIIGDNYKSLNFELLLVLLNSCLSLVMSIGLSLYLSRGWVLSPIITILVSLLSIVGGCLYFDLSNLREVLWLNVFTASIQMLLHVGFGYYKIYNIQKV